MNLDETHYPGIQTGFPPGVPTGHPELTRGKVLQWLSLAGALPPPTTADGVS